MPEWIPTPPPPRAELLRRLRGHLDELVPGLRVIAEGLLGAESAIDFVGLDPTGRAVLLLVGEEGEDLELVGRALAQRAWVEPRLRDWLQLAPGLGIRPEAGEGVWLLCPSLRPETVAAARAVGPETLSLARYRFLRDGAGVEVLIERVLAPREEPRPEAAPPPAARPPAARPPAFRTGLTDADLELSREERGEFD